MSDTVAETARFMKVVEALILELERQGLVETMAHLGFDPEALAKVAISAADGEIIPFPNCRGN